MSKTKKKVKTNLEIIQGIRRDWGNINPVTKVIPDKRRKPPKYKNNYRDDDQSSPNFFQMFNI